MVSEQKYKGFKITPDSDQVRDAAGKPDGWKPRARIWGRGAGDSIATLPVEPPVQILPTKQEADVVALDLARKWIDHYEHKTILANWANSIPPNQVANEKDRKRFVEIIQKMILLTQPMAGYGKWDWSELTHDDFVFLDRLRSELNPV